MSNAVILLLCGCVLVTTTLAIEYAVDNCIQTFEERRRCPANGDEEACLDFGCHFCGGRPKCTEGIACRREGLSDEDDCWPSSDNSPQTAKKCRRTYGCSWCKHRAGFKCVKDGPLLQNCDQTTLERTRCPANGVEAKCLAFGCYLCSGRPLCTEGIACRRTGLKKEVDDCWPSYDTSPQTAEKCRKAYLCSWCKNRVDFKCVKDGPLGDENECPAKDDRKHCPALNNPEICSGLGCYFCPNEHPHCTEGKVCKQSDISDEKYRCWPTDFATEPNPENPKECREKYGCSWCSDSLPFRCIKNIPTVNPPGSLCLEPEADLNMCYSYGDKDITESQCKTDTSCEFCPDGTNDYKCVRRHCPIGFLERYKLKSCCDPQGDGSSKRIVGGTAAEEGQWPWMVAILEDGRQICGGVLITERHVLSVAHCKITLGSKGAVLARSLSLTSLSPDKKKRKIVNQILHPNYGYPRADDNDILIFELGYRLPKSIPPLSLPHGEIVPVNQRCFVIGWGATSSADDAPGSDILNEVGIDVIAFSVCESLYAGDPLITMEEALIICAGILEGGKDSCQGDSGGPLVCQRCRNCDWYVAGLVSTGLECAAPDSPAIYTRVSNHETWIKNYVDGLIASVEAHNCDLY